MGEDRLARYAASALRQNVVVTWSPASRVLPFRVCAAVAELQGGRRLLLAIQEGATGGKMGLGKWRQ